MTLNEALTSSESFHLPSEKGRDRAWGDVMVAGVSSEILCSGAQCSCTHVYAEPPPLGPGPFSMHIPPMFSPPPARTGYQLFSEAQGHHQPDPKSAVPRDSRVSVAAMPESWCCAPEAKVSRPLAGWWESGS